MESIIEDILNLRNQETINFKYQLIVMLSYIYHKFLGLMSLIKLHH